MDLQAFIQKSSKESALNVESSCSYSEEYQEPQKEQADEQFLTSQVIKEQIICFTFVVDKQVEMQNVTKQSKYIQSNKNQNQATQPRQYAQQQANSNQETQGLGVDKASHQGQEINKQKPEPNQNQLTKGLDTEKNQAQGQQTSKLTQGQYQGASQVNKEIKDQIKDQLKKINEKYRKYINVKDRNHNFLDYENLFS